MTGRTCLYFHGIRKCFKVDFLGNNLQMSWLEVHTPISHEKIIERKSSKKDLYWRLVSKWKLIHWYRWLSMIYWNLLVSNKPFSKDSVVVSFTCFIFSPKIGKDDRLIDKTCFRLFQTPPTSSPLVGFDTHVPKFYAAFATLFASFGRCRWLHFTPSTRALAAVSSDQV